jgi:hypothetical protein
MRSRHTIPLTATWLLLLAMASRVEAQDAVPNGAIQLQRRHRCRESATRDSTARVKRTAASRSRLPTSS